MRNILLAILFFMFSIVPALGQETGPAGSVLRVPSTGGKARMGALDLNSPNATTNQLSISKVKGTTSGACAYYGASGTLSEETVGCKWDAAGKALAVGGNTIGASAALDIQSTTKGVLIPRMTTTQRDAIASPANGLMVYNTTDSKLNYYDGTNWALVGSGAGGGGGAKNFYSDYEAEYSTKIITYNDSSATPVDGTGGAVTGLSVSIDSTSKISGVKSYLISKTAASNIQGMGFSMTSDIPLDAVNSGKKQLIGFMYRPTTGYANDIEAWVYHVGSNTIEKCSGVSPTGIRTSILQALPSETAYHFCIVTQADTDTALRIVGHNITTATNTWTMNVDQVHTGNLTQIVSGAVVTDWVSYTPIWTAATTNPSIGNGSIEGKWRRVGDSAEIMIKVFAGSTTTFGSGAFRFGLPSGVALDTGKVVGSYVGITRPIGVGVALRSGTNTFILTVQAAGSSYVQAMYGNVTNDLTSTNPASWSSGDEFTLNFRIPVVGWDNSGVSINSVQADIRNTLILATGSLTNTPNNTTTKVPLTAVRDIYGQVNTSLNRIEIKESGDYKVSYKANSGHLNTTGLRAALLYKNGSQIYASQRQPDNITYTTLNLDPFIYTFNAGDYLEVYFLQTSGTTNPTFTLDQISIEKITSTSVVSSIGNDDKIQGGQSNLRMDSASVVCNSSSNFQNNLGGFSAISNISSGACNVTFTAGRYSSYPNCVASINQDPGATIKAAHIYNLTATGFTIRGKTQSSGTTGDDSGFQANVICTGPK